MIFDPPLTRGRFLRRYKRFFLDFETEGGVTLTAHCANTGSLSGCLVEGAPVLVQPNDNPKRSLRFSWKAIELAGRWVGVDTGLAVPLTREALAQGLVPDLQGYPTIFGEVPYGRDMRSRIDLLLSRGGTIPQGVGKQARKLPVGDQRVYLEVKNTTLVEDGIAMFPDAVTQRGQKHLEELIHVVQKGHRAAMCYCVQRTDCETLRPADHIDPRYGELLRKAHDAGVELYAFRAEVSTATLLPTQRLPVRL